jgi:hypothetical protein
MKKGAAAGGTAPKETMLCRQRVKSPTTTIHTNGSLTDLHSLWQAALRSLG